MSELTQCNYCSLQELKAEARRRKLRVSVLPSRPSRFRVRGMVGLNVYVHPRSVSGSELAKLGDKSPYWRSWFGDVTKSCCC
jgi:hypothetical protein